MLIFLLVFISIYSLLHFYGLVKVLRAHVLNTSGLVALIIFMLIMIFAPILVRLLETANFDKTARMLAYIGYCWMGVLFLFVCTALVLDIYRILLTTGTLILPFDLSRMALTSRQIFFVSLAVSATVAIYGSFEANRIQTEHITIKTPKIPKEVGRVRIVQISDVHIGLIVGENRLEKILDRVIAAEPDILISTGDLVDGQMDDVSTLTEMFRKIPAKMGKYAITGNHEFYAGLKRALKFTKNAGFTILRGEALSINGFLNIAGVDDMAGNSYGLTRNISEKALLSALDRDKFTLFLKHRPLLEKDATGLYDLQLSGHVHKGQIFPFSLVTMLFYPEDAGMLALDNNAFLYVSRGCGTWGPPIRFLSPPEVTIIDLVAAG
ncbi:MAG: metallophosphoesterase [Deltaproteobacteria bacterium]|nr:metallophosphoesterase [Deltaproteobacteria bacterium]